MNTQYDTLLLRVYSLSDLADPGFALPTPLRLLIGCLLPHIIRMIATPTASVVVDTIIVGGGPVGLAVALGLQQRGIDCRVVEMSTQQHLGSSDWSKTFTYSIDSRGKSLMDDPPPALFGGLYQPMSNVDHM